MPFPSSNINNLTAMAEEADAVGAVIDTNTHVMRSVSANCPETLYPVP